MKINLKSSKASDGSVKYRFITDDELFIEALYFLYDERLKVLCLSSQIGCNMGCLFCYTGKQKMIRNLSRDEIIKQAELIIDDLMPGEKPDTITLAGMGEPLANYEASMLALEHFRNKYGNIRLSLSTVGLKAGIKKMIDEKRSFGIYLSLHAGDDDTRKKIMPTAANNSISDLIELMYQYSEMNQIQGLVRISYLLLEGINDSEVQLKKLISLTQEKKFVVQFRILNEIEGTNLKKVSLEKTQGWVDELSKSGINAVIRPSLGGEINGACGQMSYKENQNNIIIDSFNEAIPFLNEIDSSTLVVFDVDSVLIIPKKIELHPFIFQKHKNIVDRLFDSLSREQKHFLNHSIVAHPSMLVEQLSVSFIKDLQKRNIPVIALTAAKKGKFNKKDVDFHHIRFKQLSSLGINFFNNLFNDDDYTSLKDTYGDYPGIRKGIIYASGLHNEKGDVLCTFLKTQKNIKKIVLFDDKLKHLQSVTQSLNGNFPMIELLTFHYQGVKTLKESRDVNQNKFERYLENLIAQVGDLSWLY